MIRKESTQLKKTMISATLALLAALFAVASASFAWYVYNTAAHTTTVHMAAGSTVSLQISNEYEGSYQSSIELVSKFTGDLTPVSTDKITNGFQKVIEFEKPTGTQTSLMAKLFGDVEETDYYLAPLFIKSSGDTELYLSNIGFDDKDHNFPISTATRVGLVVHKPGKDQAVENEYIFAISSESNPWANYNTLKGYEGCVLDSSLFGTSNWDVIEFTPYTEDAYCVYDSGTGTTALKENSIKLCDIVGGGDPVQIDVYIWLEGCDEDCTDNLLGSTLENIALSFAGY